MKTYNMKHIDVDTVGKLEVHENEKGTVQMFNFANNYQGRTFIALLKKALNKSSYSVRVRGSQSDRLSYKMDGIELKDQSVSLKYADRLRVYIEKIGVVHDNTIIFERIQKRNVELREQLDGMKVDIQEEAAQAAEAQTEVRNLKKERKILIDNYNELNKFYSHRGEKLLEKEIEINKLKHAAKDALYFGATPEQRAVCERYEDTTAVRMARSIFQGGNKLQVVAAFKQGTGQSLKDCKLICDYLVFK